MARDTQGDARQKLVEDVAAEVRRQMYLDAEKAQREAEEVERQKWLYPHDIEMERRALGAMLLATPEKAMQARDWLTIEDFYQPAHRCILRAFDNLLLRGEPLDLALIRHELPKTPQWDPDAFTNIGLFLMGLIEAVPTSANLPWYCEKIRELTVRRLMVREAEEMAERARDPAYTLKNEPYQHLLGLRFGEKVDGL